MSARSRIAMRVMRDPQLGLKFAGARLEHVCSCLKRFGTAHSVRSPPPNPGLSSPPGDRRRTDGWRRQAARETIKGCRRQDRDDRAGAGEFLQGFDPGFRQPNAARGSLIGRAPDVNEDTRAASRGAIARIVHEQTAAVERTAAHVVGQYRTDVRALGDRIVKRRGGILHADRLPGLELDVAGPPGRSKAEARSDTEETCRGAVVAFDLSGSS